MANLELVVIEPNRAPFSHPLTHGLRVGRHPSNDLVLTSACVSRRHIQFSVSNGRVVVTDLGSTQGVRIKGTTIRTTGAVAVGEEIVLGDVCLLLVERGAEPSAISLPAPETQKPPGTTIKEPMSWLLHRLASALRLDRGKEIAEVTVEIARRILGGTRAMWAGLSERGTTDVFAGDRPAASALEQRLLVEPRLDLDPVNRERSVMGAPLRAEGKVYGYLLVEETGRSTRFGVKELEQLTGLAAIGTALYENALDREKQRRVIAASDATGGEPFVGESAATRELQKDLEALATSPAHLLLVGRPGTGRRTLARAIHRRRTVRQPFVILSCGEVALAPALSSERISQALAAVGEGTLVLDEPGLLSVALQESLAQLLDLLGPAQLRLIAISDGARAPKLIPALTRRFTRRIELPPLGERREDIIPIAKVFVSRYGRRFGRHLVLDDRLAEYLRRQPLPGEARELHQLIGLVASEAVRDVAPPDEAAHKLCYDHLQRALARLAPASAP